MTTAREIACLLYLSDKMEATARMVGMEIKRLGFKCGEKTTAVGSALLGGLRKKELVMRLPDLNAWRLTAQGRKLLFNGDVEDGSAHEN